MKIVKPPKAVPGDKVAVLSPSFAAPAVAPAVHEQAHGAAHRGDRAGAGRVPDDPAARCDAARDRAADLNAAFGDPEIRAVLATIGGEDQITVIPHLDADLVRADPKPFLGYSDNTNLLHWLWTHGVAAFYGGSTQVHLGPGPAVDAVHAAVAAGRAAHRRDGSRSPSRASPRTSARTGPTRAALTEYGEREPTEPWTWAGPGASGHRPHLGRLHRGPRSGSSPPDASRPTRRCSTAACCSSRPPRSSSRPGSSAGSSRSLGERGLLGGGRRGPRRPAADLRLRTPAQRRGACRAARRAARRGDRDRRRYNPDAVVVVGVPFGHTRPQWIVPYGGEMTVDGTTQRLWADYS